MFKIYFCVEAQIYMCPVCFNTGLEYNDNWVGVFLREDLSHSPERNNGCFENIYSSLFSIDLLPFFA